MCSSGCKQSLGAAPTFEKEIRLNNLKHCCVLIALLQSLGATLLVLAMSNGMLLAEPVPVRHPEGTVHAFLSVRTSEGRVIAVGDLIQIPDGDRITLRLTFHFKDGCIQDETTVFSQRRVFRLISDHLVERGPSFPNPIDMLIETAIGNVTVHYVDSLGKDSVNTDHFDFPPDLANGLLLTLVKNVGKTQETKVSFLTPEQKPMLVKLSISTGGEEKFLLGNSSRKAVRFIVRVELQGITGLLAPIFGQQVPDTHVWIIDREAPTVLKLQGPAYIGGPIWITQQMSREWLDE
jgi:hypothetical protein